MNRYLIPVLLIMTLFMTGAFAGDGKKTEQPLQTAGDRFSYAMGLDVATALKKLETDINMEAFLTGVKDSFNGTPRKLSAEEIAAAKKEIAAAEREKRNARLLLLSQKNLGVGEAFLLENKKKDDVVTTPSGLQYKVLRRGNGKKPVLEDTVSVHYRAMKIDGTEYDNSYSRGKPVVVPVKGVIPGWSEALQLMSEDSKYRVFMPSRLAYGDKQAGPKGEVKPNETLIFDVELFGIDARQSASQGAE
jgi:FKBP-type peptidyl-prolyl cis-trans isomerase